MSHMLPSPRPLILALALCGLASQSVLANDTPQALPFAQNWSDSSLISVDDDWSSVPGILGFRGDGITGATAINPQTLLGEGTITIDVIANQTAPNTLTAGGVAEFELTNPTIALNGSGTADAPNLVIHLDTSGKTGIQVSYNLRDLDSSGDNAIQPVALQYRVGNTGNFVDVAAGYVADASSGPNQATLVTPVSTTLPVAAENQPLVQLRIITANAGGNDEWIGVDDILVSGSTGSVANQPIQTVCGNLSLAMFESGMVQLSASDADSIVGSASITDGSLPQFSLSNFVAADMDGASASVQLNASGALDGGLAAGNYPVTVTFSNDDAQTAACTVTVTVSDITRIPEIQGTGSSSPLVGQSVTTEGVVTKRNNNGFYLQDETGDGDDATSDGVFVFTSTTPTVSVGDKLRLTAKVTEFNTGAASNAQTLANPLTELTNVSSLSVLGDGFNITPTVITFPEISEGDLERYEGMLVEIATPLTASQNYFQGRYGQVTLSAEGRLIKPTNVYRAGTQEALDLANDNARRRIILDDSTSIQNPNPTPYFATDDTLRAGDTLPDGLIGVIDYGLATNNNTGLADYRIHPAQTVVFTRSNPRTSAPEAVGGNLRVASFNVLNYFTTFINGQTVDGQSGQGCSLDGAVAAANCRGANNLAEFERQQAKIVAALVALNADVVGLMEIQNNGNTAANNLVTALNAAMGAGTYASVNSPSGGTGTDAIRVAMIYKPAKIAPVGNAISDTNAIHSRPPLAQTFAAANGEKFSVVVNHFKSKGSCPASGDDADQGDGQGCWNILRLEQAQALRSFIADIQNDVGDDDVIVMGDLNAYGREEPIADFLDNGYVDQISRFDSQGYSYVFDGESGYLDHALTTPSMSDQVVGTRHWHINADEPSVIDYNLEFKLPACLTCGPDYYTSTAYRSSDHDPVLIGLNLVKQVAGATAGRDVLSGTPGDDVIFGGPGADTLTGGNGSDRFVYTSLRDAGDIITDFQSGIDRLDLTALLQSLAIVSAAPLTSGHVVCTAIGNHASVAIDPDGNSGPAAKRALTKLNNVSCGNLMNPGNFAF